jgi:hypothetical protein
MYVSDESHSPREQQPFDSKPSNSGLLGKNIPSNLIEDGLGWRISIELIRIVFIVDVVSDSDKFSVVVGASKKNHSDTQDLRIGDFGGVRWVGFEDKLVDTNRYGADEETIEILVMFRAVRY